MSAQKYLIKKARVIDSRSSHHLQVVDLLLANGEILEIGSELKDSEAEVFEAPNLHISIGWLDLRANFNDPGNEDREDIQSGATAAARGGFTSVALSPETNPVIDNKAAVQYLLKQAEGQMVNLLPIAAFSKDLKGEELSEVYDMKATGAIAFSHGGSAVSNSALMRLALLYNREIGPALQILSQDKTIRSNGQMHEGDKSTWLGLKGIPALSESLAVNRDIALAEYCQSPIHFQAISSAEALKIIEEKQAAGQAISADVNLMNLLFSEEDLKQYDSNLKVYPPLRSQADQKALIEALKKGSLSAIASNHQPRTIEEKRCEFDLAKFGAATLEGFFGALNAKWGSELGLDRIIELISQGPRKILDYQRDLKIEKGAKVELSLFDPELDYSWSDLQLHSKAANYPFKSLKLKGKAVAIYQKSELRKLA